MFSGHAQTQQGPLSEQRVETSNAAAIVQKAHQLPLCCVVIGQLLLCLCSGLARDTQATLQQGTTFLLGVAAVREGTRPLAALYGLACFLALLWLACHAASRQIASHDPWQLPWSELFAGSLASSARSETPAAVFACLGVFLAARLHADTEASPLNDCKEDGADAEACKPLLAHVSPVVQDCQPCNAAQAPIGSPESSLASSSPAAPVRDSVPPGRSDELRQTESEHAPPPFRAILSARVPRPAPAQRITYHRQAREDAVSHVADRFPGQSAAQRFSPAPASWWSKAPGHWPPTPPTPIRGEDDESESGSVI